MCILIGAFSYCYDFFLGFWDFLIYLAKYFDYLNFQQFFPEAINLICFVTKIIMIMLFKLQLFSFIKVLKRQEKEANPNPSQEIELCDTNYV